MPGPTYTYASVDGRCRVVVCCVDYYVFDLAQEVDTLYLKLRMIKLLVPYTKFQLLRLAIIAVSLITRTYSFNNLLLPSSLLPARNYDKQNEKNTRPVAISYGMSRAITTSTAIASGNNKNADDNDYVNVNIVKDIDPLTITAIGFSLIALNFFVFANLGE